MERSPAGTATSIVIFGASGDLTERKLIPALYTLHRTGRLPDPLNVVGISRTSYSHEDFRDHLCEFATEVLEEDCNNDAWNDFAQHVYYHAGNSTNADDYAKLDEFLQSLENGPANRLYYLSVAPNLYVPIVKNLGKQGMAREKDGCWRNIVVEKPFGHDLKSAQELNDVIHHVFDEHQIYRIDHYLGKETAQNILFFRFANTIWEPVWNRNYVDHVQITVLEEVEVGHRAGYYDTAGVLRDMFQNHLLQLLALVAMEPPASFNADALRNEKVKVLSAIRPIQPRDTVRARYEGYLQEPGVVQNSMTATYGALKLFVDNWRWQGVPFYLRSGKATGVRSSEVVIQFKSPPHMMFNQLTNDGNFKPNTLSLCIQPDEGIHLKFEAKVPGSHQETRSVDMDFHYRESFGTGSLPDAYVRLLLDALNGDASLFTRSDEIEMAWRLIEPVLDAWEQENTPRLAVYPRGTMGPIEADEFLSRDGRAWHAGCEDHE
jgi:glucose-6-phosphate 1-dehydrogenase